MGLHKDSTDIHVPYAWSYADTAAREAAVGMVPGDVGKLARQLDDNSLWMLTDDSPLTWVAVGGAATELEFAVVKRTAGDYTVAAGGSFVDVDTSNVTITFTTGARRVRLVLQASGGNGSSGGTTMIDFTVDGTRVGNTQGLLVLATPTASNNQNCHMEYITDVLTAASHTFRVQWKADTGTGTLRAATATTPLVFWAEELNITS